MSAFGRVMPVVDTCKYASKCYGFQVDDPCSAWNSTCINNQNVTMCYTHEGYENSDFDPYSSTDGELPTIDLTSKCIICAMLHKLL